MDPWTVSIRDEHGNEQRLTSRAIVIAAGAAPVVPPLPGLDAVECLTSETLWDAMATRPEPPARLVVLGGGPIGCELAQAFARLGSQVTVVEMLPRLLGREDEEAAAVIAETLAVDGVSVHTGHRAVRCEPGENGAPDVLVTECDGAEHRHAFDTLLCAIGRRPRLTGYGLEDLGIDTGAPLVANDYLETLYPNIFAAGDVAGPYQFTHVASHQAWYAAVNALFGQFKRFAVDYRVIPRVTYTDPEVASVGLTEAEAAEAAGWTAIHDTDGGRLALLAGLTWLVLFPLSLAGLGEMDVVSIFGAVMVVILSGYTVYVAAASGHGISPSEIELKWSTLPESGAMSSATSENGSVDGGASAVTVCARCRSRLIALRLRTTSDMSVPSTTSASCSYGAARVAPLLGRLVGRFGCRRSRRTPSKDALQML